VTARSDARAAEISYRNPPEPFMVGDRVMTSAGIGYVEYVAWSRSMESPLYTVAVDQRTKLRLLARDLQPLNGGRG